MPNRLKDETSPYLLQHADNPVDWYPWGPEALGRARAEHKPIFLSIGYAACHWCHVMERESFEDPGTAALLNEHFVAIKVDREERPDVDDVYMQAVHAMGRPGGWPLNVFLTSAGQPFYGGTYFPPADRHGLPSFRAVLSSVARAWEERRTEIEAQAGQLAQGLQLDFAGAAAGELEPGVLARAAARLERDFDPVYGGFGAAPKFPQPSVHEALLRAWRRSGDEGALAIVTRTLDALAQGGIYDQIGGGFARYSTDREWLVPHFEKMLYDNAQLVRLYTRAWQITRAPRYAQVVAETVDWVLREMTHPAGGFYSSLDADSEGEEGRFYLWTMDEIESLLGHDDARLANLAYGLYDGPNFEGRNILHRPRALDRVAATAGVELEDLNSALARTKSTLLAARAARVWPGRDDKVLASWNGLMLAGLAEAARVFGREDWRAAAVRNADFLVGQLRDPGGRLLHSWKAAGAGDAGEARIPGFLEDYAFLLEGLLALYQLTFETRWFSAARELAAAILTHFGAAGEWGFYDTADDAERLIVRPKNLQDGALPSPNAAAALGLLQLGAYTGDERYRAAVLPGLRALSAAAEQVPQGFGYWLCALDFAVGPVDEVAVVGDPAAPDTAALLAVAQQPYRPNQVVALSPGPGAPAAEIVPLLAERPVRDGRATAYVCRQFACRLPVNEPDALAQLLSGESSL
jgi:uncharacterized protein YyaL (SSP411 family)